MFSDESSYSLFPTAERVYNPGKLTALKHKRGSVMVWAAISWNSLGHIVPLHGRINSKDYMNILGDRVHPTVRALFRDGDDIFQDDTAPIYSAHVVKNWYEEHRSGHHNLQISILLSICGESCSDKLGTVTLHRRV